MEAGGLDILGILLQSGPVVKFVLFLLVACSLLSWTIIFQKNKKLKKVTGNNKDFHDFFNSSKSLEVSV